MNMLVHTFLGSRYYCSLSQELTFDEHDTRLPSPSCSTTPTCSKEQLSSYCAQATDRVRSLLLDQEMNQSEEMRAAWKTRLLCPISGTILHNPVKDNHGHRFASGQAQIGDICPISHTEITQLRPDAEHKELVNSLLALQVFIPFLSTEPGRSDKVDEKVKIAESYMKGGKYAEALVEYYRLCQETNRSEDYEGLPPLFKYMLQPYKAALAYLHLAHRQLQEDKYNAADKNIWLALDCIPRDETLQRLRAFSYLYHGKLNKAVQTFYALGTQLALEGKDALPDLEQVLACGRTNSKVYDDIAHIVEDKVQVRLFLMGLIHFYETDRAVAKQFYEKARAIQPRNPLIYLALLCRLPDDDMEKIELYRILTQIFIEKNELQKAHYCFQQVFTKGQKAKDIQEYIDNLRKGGAREEAET
ncbi:MAG: hypothetical protein JSR46_05870, partial [Verrucomicrobia bacterium]|nr:hypothetical protein [Verrucomicrobiota bacterium]